MFILIQIVCELSKRGLNRLWFLSVSTKQEFVYIYFIHNNFSAKGLLKTKHMQKKKTDAFVQGEYLFLLQGCAIHSEIIMVIGVQCLLLLVVHFILLLKI